jgi:recombination protein RecA
MTIINKIEQGGSYKPTFYLPTPSEGINKHLNNGGVPSNAIIQYQSSTEGSFKSTVALQMLAKAQEMGLNVGFIDGEMAMDNDWARQIGVDTDKWFYTQPTSGEKGFELCFEMIQSHDCKVVVIDSIDSLQPEHLHDASLGDAHIGNHAKLHSKAIRQALPIIAKHDAIIIGINQKRVNLTPMGARGYNAGGGKGWGFYSKLIIECNRGSAKSNNDKEILDLDLYVEKNKLGKSFFTVKEKVEQGVGIIKEYSILESLIESKVITKHGAGWYRYNDEPIAQGDQQIIKWIRENESRIRA